MNLSHSQDILLIGLLGFLFWVSFEIFVLAREQIIENRFKKSLPPLIKHDSMSARMTHEIANPLSVIQSGVTELLKEAKDEVIKQDLAQILLSVERISQITENTRNYLYQSEDSQDAPVDLKKVIDDVLLFHSQRLENHHIELYFKNVEDIIFDGDRGQLEQLLLDMLSTSIDAVEELPEKWIEISAIQTNENVHVSFRNSGYGISEEIGRRLNAPIHKNHGSVIRYQKAPHTTFILDIPVTHHRHSS